MRGVGGEFVGPEREGGGGEKANGSSKVDIFKRSISLNFGV